MVSTTNWTLTDLYHTFLDDVLYVHAITDVPVHLELCATKKKPDEHKHRTQKRGMDWYVDIKYCFVEYTCYDQKEAGDTLHHNWELADWPVSSFRWYIMRGTMAGQPSPSNTPIFRRERQEGEQPMLVINLGEYLDPNILVGEVKLEEGPGITIVRHEGHNSLIISSTAAAQMWNACLVKMPCDTIDGWETGVDVAPSIVEANTDGIRLYLRNHATAWAYAFRRYGGPGVLDWTKAIGLFVAARVYGSIADVDWWLTIGRQGAVPHQAGFWINDGNVRGYWRGPAGTHVTPVIHTLAAGDIFTAQIDWIPATSLTFTVNGVLTETTAFDLPTGYPTWGIELKGDNDSAAFKTLNVHHIAIRQDSWWTT